MSEPLTKQEREALEGIRCGHCGGFHVRACPRVKELKFYQDGSIAGVKFWKDWSTEGVFWDLDDEEEDNDVVD